MKQNVLNGVDTLERTGNLLKGKRLGLITNPSGTCKDMTATLDLLKEKYDLRALYAPEHGIRGDAQAGEPIATQVDPRTGLTAYSIYGGGGELNEENTRDIDMMVCDIQDVGIRFTTYMYTMSYSLEYCAAHHIPFVVLDRVNPVGGTILEGTVLDERFRSFVGDYSLPTRHGLTYGELARYLAATRPEQFGAELTVIPVENWDRALFADETDLSWVNPSPNLPSVDTLVVYIGNCLFEGTNVSEGRGTTIPFHHVGAPWLRSYDVVAAMNEKHLPGVRFRAGCFTPTFHKYKGELCYSVQTHVTDRREYKSFETGLYLLEVIRDLHPDRFEYIGSDRPDGTKTWFLDLLLGTDIFRTGRMTAKDMIDYFKPEIDKYRKNTEPFLLYK